MLLSHASHTSGLKAINEGKKGGAVVQTTILYVVHADVILGIRFRQMKGVHFRLALKIFSSAAN